MIQVIGSGIITETPWRSEAYHAKHPINATNLSKSAAPHELITVVKSTNAHRKVFFVHLTRASSLPLLTKSPFSRIRMAGKSWRGTERRIASAYRN